MTNRSPAADDAWSSTQAEKELIGSTRAFASERRPESLWYVASTCVALGSAIAVAAAAPHWPLRLAGSILAGLVIVRGFVLYHDVLHGSLLRSAPFLRRIFYAYGVLVLTPPRVWRQTHNYHHAHTAQLVGSHVGSFATVNVSMWKKMSGRQRFRYLLARHPLTVLCAYFTVFLYGVCLSSFLRDPKKNWDSGLALVENVHVHRPHDPLAGLHRGRHVHPAAPADEELGDAEREAVALEELGIADGDSQKPAGVQATAHSQAPCAPLRPDLPEKMSGCTSVSAWIAAAR